MAITPELSRAKKRLGVSLALAIGLGTFALVESSNANSQPSAAVHHMAKLSINQASTTAEPQATTASSTTTALTTTTTVAPTTTTALTPAQWAAEQVTTAEYYEWSKVNQCEESGNWHVNGSMYAGGLGISRTNWSIYGGQRDFGDEASATPYEQIVVAKRIQPYPPDQNGCAAW